MRKFKVKISEENENGEIRERNIYIERKYPIYFIFHMISDELKKLEKEWNKIKWEGGKDNEK